MNTRNSITALIALTLLAGCGLMPERKPVDYKNGATAAQALEVPPDLVMRQTEQRYAIPAADGKTVASYSDYMKQPAGQPCAAPDAMFAPGPVVLAKLLDTNGGKVVQLDEPFDRSWRRIGLALEQARIKASDVDRSKGIYYVTVEADKKAAEYQVKVRTVGAGSETSVVNAKGKSDTDAVKFLETLFQNLGGNQATAAQ